MLIKEATAADAPGIARIHVDTWRTAYAGIMPADVLDRLSYEAREHWWLEILSEPKRSFVYVADNKPKEVLGYASGGPNRGDDLAYEGELYGIYVLQAYQGRGIGRALVKVVADRLALMGLRSMVLWVLADNQPARRFYEGLGGQLGGEKEREFGGAVLKEVSYGWPNVTILGEHER